MQSLELEAPEVERYLPVAQLMQTLDAVWDWYCPATQLAQSDEVEEYIVATTLPAAQSVQEVDPELAA